MSVVVKKIDEEKGVVDDSNASIILTQSILGVEKAKAKAKQTEPKDLTGMFVSSLATRRTRTSKLNRSP